MAVDNLERWQTIRNIVSKRLSGVLILQLGTNYLHWTVEKGMLVTVSSSLPDNSFSEFLSRSELIDPAVLTAARAKVDERSSLASILLHMRVVTEKEACVLLQKFWRSLSMHLLRSSVHLFWSDRPVVLKADFLRCDMPFAGVILPAPRDCIEIQASLRCARVFPARLRMAPQFYQTAEEYLQPGEKRILYYLKSSANLAQILRDPELDHFTCYKLLFLFWLCGCFQELSASNETKPDAKFAPWLVKIRGIPPEWIFPLFAGILIGVLFAPDAPNPPPEKQAITAPHVESLKEALQEPAWRHSEEEEQEEKSKF